ncbi:MAG: hypothetical protein ACR2L6_12170 [Gemmatimonadaceae bacterium]
MRERVKRDMRAAPFQEHKLQLGTYLESDAGSSLMTMLSAHTKNTRPQLLALLRSVRSLEFYMPVQAHRETWTGSADVLVASAIRDSDPLIAYNTRGEPIALSGTAPPAAPTFVIVPVETNFSKPMDMNRAVNVKDAGGKAIGTLAPDAVTARKSTQIIEDPEGGSSGSSSPGPAGLYMTFSRLGDMGEPWFRGNPEIEVHIHGPLSQANSQYGADLACAGEHALPYRVFDQNNVFWNGNVLLFTRDQEIDFNNSFFEGHNILFWEDDDTACVIKTDKYMLRSVLGTTTGAIGGAAVKFAGGSGWIGVLSTFLGVLYDSADWLLSNDDFLGAAVPAASNGDQWSDANYTILRGTDINGRIKLEWKY